MNRRFHKSSAGRGSALVITLAFVVLITILALGIFTATRMEVTASRLHYDGIRADFYAKSGEGIALARLLAGTSGTNRAWISQPGRLLVSPTNAPSPVTNVVELHSGSPDGVSSNEWVDLNPARIQNPAEHLIFPTNLFQDSNAAMPVRWIYARKDGSFETNAPPAYSATNPVVGRIAFWVDDESTKINLNTAWTRDISNTNAPSHPSRIDLGVIFGNATATDIANFRTNISGHFFNSPLDIRQMGGAISTNADLNSGSLTHYSHTPNLNMFGEKRIMLTTQKSLAGTNDFLDILTTSNADPGKSANISFAKVNNLLANIMNQLSRTNWPFDPGHSFAAKYSANWAREIMANLIEYVRCKESTNYVVDPIRYGTNSSGELIANGDHWYIGPTRAPQITEMGVWIAPSPYSSTYPITNNRGTYSAKYFFELCLPKGTGEVDLANTNNSLIYLQMINGDGSFTPASGPSWPAIIKNIPIRPGPAPGSPDDMNAYLDSSDTILREGQRRTVTFYQTALLSSANNGFIKWTRPTKLAFRGMITRVEGGDVWLSSAPTYLNWFDNAYLPYMVDGTNVPVANITSVSTVDPLVGKSYKDWTQGANSFGFPDPNPSQSYPGPQQDTDASGNIFTDGAFIPARKGSTNNPAGIVESVAELGWIHTGVTSYPSTNAGVPWRTLRLQPQKSGSTDFPDWAVLDLFCAPVEMTPLEKAVGQPLGNVRGGLVNLNSEAAPFAGATNAFPLIRSNPFNALFSGVKKDGSTNALSQALIETIRGNIQSRTLANSQGNQGITYGSGTATNILFTPAQIVEYAGVADRGEASESVLREMLDVAAIRSSVFTIYSVGQAVSQDASGTLRVLAESRKQRTIELTSPNSATTGGFNTIFNRRLLP